MINKKSAGFLVYLLVSSCCWGLYVLGLILVSKQVLDEYLSTDNDKYPTTMKGVVTFLLVPQYVTSFAYLLAMIAFSIDMLSKEKRRIHFMTTLFTNSVSMVLLLTAGVSMFINITLIVYAAFNHQHQHQDNLVGSGDNTAVVSEHNEELILVMSQIIVIASWAKTLFFCLAAMLGLYSFYYCYWPHSLRYRQRVNKRLLSNIADVDDEDDDEL